MHMALIMTFVLIQVKCMQTSKKGVFFKLIALMKQIDISNQSLQRPSKATRFSSNSVVTSTWIY